MGEGQVDRGGTQLGGAGGDGAAQLEQRSARRTPTTTSASCQSRSPGAPSALASASLAANRAASEASGRVGLGGREQPLDQPGRTTQRRPRSARCRPRRCRRRRSPRAAYSTVTDLARLRGWSTSWPSRGGELAGEQLQRYDGRRSAAAASGPAAAGSARRRTASTSSSPSSASTIVRAPRARISWIALTILSCSWSRPCGGTTQNTGSPASISAIGPCLSSPAANPSAWM